MHDRRAGAAITFGLAAIPTFAFLGFAVDYGVALAGKAKLDVAADAASMVAVNTAKTVIQGSSTPGASATASAVQQGQAQAQLAFKANAGAIGYTTLPTPTVTITRTNQTLTATVSYTTQSKSNFSRMFGLAQSNMQGTSTATLTMPTYINYYIVVDTSQSMGIGSTTSDMLALYNRVVKYGNASGGEAGCVFGCHVKAPGQAYTNEYLAHSVLPKITLRIDAAASAVATIVSDANAAQAASGQSLIKIGLYTMQQDPSSGNTIATLASPQYSPFTNVTTASASMDLGNNTSAGVGDSDFYDSIANFTSNILPAQGDGSTASSPLNYVFLITDGVQDVAPPGTPDKSVACSGSHCVQAFNQSYTQNGGTNLCAQIKAKATVGVIYTTYNPIYYPYGSSNVEGNYTSLVAPIAANIVPGLQACASTPTTKWYFEASDGPAITTGMQQLFATTSQAARLAQ